MGGTGHRLAGAGGAPLPHHVADPPGDGVVEREPPPPLGRLDSLRHALSRHARKGEKSAGVAARRAGGGGRPGLSAGTRSGNMGWSVRRFRWFIKDVIVAFGQ